MVYGNVAGRELQERRQFIRDRARPESHTENGVVHGSSDPARDAERQL
jgi:hypothetical protein